MLRIARVWFVVVCGSVIIVFAMLGWYAWPVADDYSHAWRPAGVGATLDSVAQVYASYGGLYSAALFRYVHATVTRMEGYWFFCWVILVSHGIALYALLRNFLGRQGSVMLTLGCLAAFLVRMPHVGEYLYWATGALVYATGTLAVLLVLLLTLKKRASSSGSASRKIVMIGIFILMIGIHWPFALWGVLWALAYAATDWRSGGSEARFWRVLSALAIICFLVVLVAPGNLHRAGGVEKAVSMTTRELGKSAFGYLYLLYSSLFNVPILALSAIAVAELSDQDHVNHSSQWTLPGWVPLVTWAAASLGTFIVSGLGGLFPPAGRTLDALLMMFVASWVTFLGLSGSGLAKSLLPHARGILSRRFQLFLLLLFPVSILLDGNLRPVFTDLVQRGPEFKKEMLARDKALKDARAAGLKCATVEHIKNVPKTFHWDDIDGSPDDWKNPNISKFYGLERITLEGQMPCP